MEVAIRITDAKTSCNFLKKETISIYRGWNARTVLSLTFSFTCRRSLLSIHLNALHHSSVCPCFANWHALRLHGSLLIHLPPIYSSNVSSLAPACCSGQLSPISLPLSPSPHPYRGAKAANAALSSDRS